MIVVVLYNIYEHLAHLDHVINLISVIPIGTFTLHQRTKFNKNKYCIFVFCLIVSTLKFDVMLFESQKAIFRRHPFNKVMCLYGHNKNAIQI